MSNSVEPIWARAEPGGRRPRYTREQIAAVALGLADREGMDAVSMRRIALELGAGTMTLYHYVRTKADLVDLMDDTIMAEVVVPDGELSPNWREALTQIAIRSRDAFGRHPWALEGLRGARGGPNGMKHFEQTLAAVSSLELPFAEKLEVALVVDDYVFGYVLRSLQAHAEDPREELRRSAALDYLGSLLATGEYPHIEQAFAGLDVLQGVAMMEAAYKDPSRFERGLERLLDGIDARLTSYGSRKRNP
jgi:AcrR family transcriptional regulator